MNIINEPLTCRPSDGLPDWYVIERRDHDGRQELRPIGPGAMALWCSSRISDADVEGTGAEMCALALAIKAGKPESFRRCAVEPRDGGFAFWSPRNSQTDAVVSADVAVALADEILTVVQPPTRPPSGEGE